jgi:peptide/nickel transport system ATP-binding protein
MNAPSVSPAVAESMIEIVGLKKYFGHPQRPVRAVDDVSFSIARGEVVGLVGESGSGKSTIGRSILKLTEPSAGQVLYQGKDLAGLSQRAMRPYRRDLQIIFQDPYASLNPRLRIGDIIGEALDTHKLKQGAARRERIVELLQLVGLASPAHWR